MIQPYFDIWVLSPIMEEYICSAMKPIEQLKLNIALLEAAQREDGAEDIRRLLAAGADMDVKYGWSRGKTVDFVLRYGTPEMFCIVTQDCAGIDMKTQGVKMLKMVSREHLDAYARYFMDKGLSMQSMAEDSYFISEVAGCSASGLLRNLLKYITDTETLQQEHTWLHAAAEHGCAENVQLLLDAGMMTNARDKKGNTPLHLAVKSGDAEKVRLLLQAGADVQAENEEKETSLYAALSLNPSSGREKITLMLIQAGADVNAREACGYTPLHCACASGDSAMVKLLIENGANVNAVNHDGQTPLHFAIENAECIRLLLKAGADVNASYDKKTPMLMHIVSVGVGWSLKGIALMLHAGLRVDVKDRNGNTPLLKLLQQYRREFRYYGCPHWFGCQPLNAPLLKTSFAEFITSIQRRTWYTDYNALVLLLLEHGAELNAVNDRGESVLDFAHVYCAPPVYGTLRLAGAKYGYEMGDERQKQRMEDVIRSITPIKLPKPKEWNTVDDVLEYARACSNACGLNDWVWKVEKNMMTYGLCIPNGTIKLSDDLMERDHLFIRYVIIHELAHALTGFSIDLDAHGHVWARICAALGIPDVWDYRTGTFYHQKIGLEGLATGVSHLLCHRETGEVFHVYKARPKLTAKRLAKMSIRGREEETRGKLCVSAIPAERGERTLFAECSEDGKTINYTSKEIPRMTERRLRDSHAQGRRLCYLLTLENMVDYECA